jgi:hypothetical protein
VRVEDDVLSLSLSVSLVVVVVLVIIILVLLVVLRVLFFVVQVLLGISGGGIRRGAARRTLRGLVLRCAVAVFGRGGRGGRGGGR